MTPATIITMPAGVAPDLDALRREFGHTVVRQNWHPSRQVIPGVLHLTCMHPEDLRDAGCHEFIERGWPQPVAMPPGAITSSPPCASTSAARRQRGVSTLCINVCLALFLTTCAVFVGPALDDIKAEQDVADDLQQAPASVAAQQRKERAEQLMCGNENATAVPQADGSTRCEDTAGRTTTTIPAHRGAA